MSCPWALYIYGFTGIVGIGIIYMIRKSRKKFEFNDAGVPKDTVLLMGFPPGGNTPNGSPFVLKVQTYLRMAKIPHKMNTDKPFGPKGKSPWIILNGEAVADSEFIIQHLNKKFKVNLNTGLTEEQIATAESLRIMLDEHFIWGIAMERFLYNGYYHVDQLFKMPCSFGVKLLKLFMWYTISKRSKAQGIGLHSEAEVEEIMSKDLRIVSKILGSKKFICGDKPCLLDCGIFSHVSQAVWALPKSPYEKLVKGELSNLSEYCERMRDLYWKDWDKIVSSQEYSFEN